MNDYDLEQIMMESAPEGGQLRTVVSSMTRKSCWFFHRWELVRDSGATRYYECSKCQNRRADQLQKIYQPIDMAWMRYESIAIPEPPRAES